MYFHDQNTSAASDLKPDVSPSHGNQHSSQFASKGDCHIQSEAKTLPASGASNPLNRVTRVTLRGLTDDFSGPQRPDSLVLGRDWTHEEHMMSPHPTIENIGIHSNFQDTSMFRATKDIKSTENIVIAENLGDDKKQTTSVSHRSRSQSQSINSDISLSEHSLPDLRSRVPRDSSDHFSPTTTQIKALWSKPQFVFGSMLCLKYAETLLEPQVFEDDCGFTHLKAIFRKSPLHKSLYRLAVDPSILSAVSLDNVDSRNDTNDTSQKLKIRSAPELYEVQELSTDDEEDLNCEDDRKQFSINVGPESSQALLESGKQTK